MEISFIPIDYDYFDYEGKNYIKLIGRDEKGKRVCIIDSFEPYFWAIFKDKTSDKQIEKIKSKIEKIKISSSSRTTKVEKVEIKDKSFLSKQVKALKIFITNFKDAHPVADKLGMKEISARRGYDLNLISLYISEKKITPLSWYKVSGEILNNSQQLGGIDSSLDVDLVIKAESIQPSEQHSFQPKILAFDIEADEFEIGKGEIVMISLVSQDFKKVLTWKKCESSPGYVECFKDEADMIEAFVKYIKQQDPDLLAGYFSDGFDLPYLRARAEKNQVKLSLGLDNKQPSFARGRIPSAKIDGIVHVDLFRFIETAYSQYLQSETLSLNEVALELLGEKKLEFNHIHSSKINGKEWLAYFEYNLQDSLLTYKLAEKLWPDMLEFSKIIQEPLFQITRNGMSQLVENYLLHNLDKYNEIPEKHPIYEEIGARQAREKYEGAFVLQPKPSLYENLAVFDFTSMYASIIVSFNLSLASFSEKKIPGSHEAIFKNKKVYFSKKPSFFPLMLADIVKKRRQYKEEYKKNPNNLTKARSNAYKLLANASYGYQGFFGARYYCLEAAAATAYFAREFIKQVIDKTNQAGFSVIYADSVDGKTKVMIKKGEEISEINIEDLFEKVDKINLQGKEYNFKEDIEVLTLDEKGNSIFKPVKYVMKHKCNKKMYRVNFTNNWYIDVTEDHSLMGYQSVNFNQSKENRENPLNRIIEVKPEEIKKKANTIISLKRIPYENAETKNYPKEVYEFMGYFIGDGSFRRNKAQQKYNKDYYLGLSLGSDKQELLDRLIYPLKKQGYVKNFWLSKTRLGDLMINGLKLVDLISKNFRDEKGKKIIPSWLFMEKDENIASFLRGLFSADGCVMIRNGAPLIKYTSIEEGYIKEVRKLLYRVGISHSVFKENSVNKYKTKNKIYSSGTYSKNILIHDKENFCKKIGFILDRKDKSANIKTDGLKRKSIKNLEFDIQAVKSIEQISTPEYIYDIEVEDNHRFFANYILVHNTDGFSFTLNKKTKQDTLNFLKKLNESLPGIMELELEDFYKRGIWVTKRTGEFGAKKKYALITDLGKLKIRGFETVRRDWCDLARELQNKVLKLILQEGNETKALELTKQVLIQLKERKIDKKQILIRTQLKKPISEYKAISPHVIAAQKMQEANMPVDVGMLVEYYVAEVRSEKEKKLVREKVKLPQEKGEYNINYYINNQILPAVENIFEVFNINIKEIASGKKQKKLLDF